MVERNLAKVEVESSSLFSRSRYEGQYGNVLPFSVCDCAASPSLQSSPILSWKPLDKQPDGARRLCSLRSNYFKPHGAVECADGSSAANAGCFTWRKLLQRPWLMAKFSAWLLPPSHKGLMCSSVAAAGSTCSPQTQQGTTPCICLATVL